MKAIVLSAGQGKRLLPLTESAPKCMLTIDGDRSILEIQLRTLAACGVERTTVVAGFGAEHVDRFLSTTPIVGMAVETIYNPFFSSSDNLATCWLARHQMEQDFVLLNGDTLFEEPVLGHLLDGAEGPITVSIDHKSSYDDDDMKVSIDDDGRMLAIGKTLKPETVNGESIGMLHFAGPGPRLFRDALERTIRSPEALRAWYLSVINDLAQENAVGTVSVHGLWWREVDAPEDLEDVRRSFPDRGADPRSPESAVRASV
ncbi:MAG: phosphocholine cytidylyltransferase family protein [Myxococcales bacterium]|nr:phosphocholine cytidylyltransferase family protein [Myxococcales bacterium]